MSSATILFLLLRLVHVLLAALWVGGMGFLVLFVFPSLRDTGAASAPMMGAMARRGLSPVMAALGGTTALSGMYLYWRLTGHFDPALSGTRSAMVFGTGGMLGILAVIIGAAVVGRSARRMLLLGGQALALPDGPERASLTAQSGAARDRALTWARVVLVLQAIAVASMAVGHYV